MPFQYALVREPGARFPRCISSHPLWHTIDASLARQQWKEYCNTLSELGLEVIHLPRDDDHPDSCFVEDAAIIHEGKALIARLAPETRKGEEIAVEEMLNQLNFKTKRAVPPATIEGGDIIHLPNRILCGVTKRTNMEGATQLASWLGVRVDTYVDPFIVHLKSYATYVGKSRMIAARTFANELALRGFSVLAVPDEESQAANALTIGNTALMPSGCPQAQALVRSAGFDVVPLNVSEFQKCDGALTCLSILF